MEKYYDIFGMRVDTTSFKDASLKILKWAIEDEPRYVCVANVQMVMESYDDTNFMKIVNEADLVTPDGMPLVWFLRYSGVKNQKRVDGPTLMPQICQMAAQEKIPVGFLGSTPFVNEQLVKNVQRMFPDLPIVYACSPPFHELSPDENKTITDGINRSGAKILFVGLGCPKQERWMASQKNKVSTVMIGIGAAFEIYARTKKRAPFWMQRSGLEWMYRFIQEPKRMGKKYLKNNPRFLILMGLSMLKSRLR